MKQSESLSFYECGIEHCVPGHSCGPKVRSKTVIHVVKEGKGKLYVGDKVFEVKENQAFLVSANLNVYYEADLQEPWKYCWIAFLGTEMEEYSEKIFGKNNYVKDISNVEKFWNIIENITEKYYNESDESIEEKYGKKLHVYPLQTRAELFHANAVIYEFLAYLFEENDEKLKQDITDYAEKIKNYIDNYFQEITEVSKIAELFHIHPNYLASIFKEKYHVSPKQYVLDRKINYACYLLEETDRSVQEIAFMCGFSSLPSFGKIFKKNRSVSPGEYRRLCAHKKMSLSYWNNIASYEK